MEIEPVAVLQLVGSVGVAVVIFGVGFTTTVTMPSSDLHDWLLVGYAAVAVAL